MPSTTSRFLRPPSSALLLVLPIAWWTPAGLLAAGPPVLVVPGDADTLHVAVDLPADVKITRSVVAWHLVEVDRPEVRTAAQLVLAINPDGTAAKDRRRLLAAIPPSKDAAGPRRFQLVPRDEPAAGEFRFADLDDKSLKLCDGEKPVLVYNHGVITNQSVPENDHRRSRGCYIHPVWGLNGEVLTDDFSKDHYHHHGIFWTWPNLGIGDEQYDLYRFVGWIDRQSGPAAAVLAVENGWFVGEKKVMIERLWMRTYRVSGDTRSLDLEFAWIPVDQPITLWGAGGKSYGGLTVRFDVQDQKAAVITVPDGRTTADLYETPLSWVDLTYPFEGAPNRSGAAIFVSPDHPDSPPTWLTRHYGRLCVGWPGVKPKTLAPGKPIRLSYRVLIHKTELEVAALSRAYANYTAAMEAEFE